MSHIRHWIQWPTLAMGLTGALGRRMRSLAEMPVKRGGRGQATAFSPEPVEREMERWRGTEIERECE